MRRNRSWIFYLAVSVLIGVLSMVAGVFMYFLYLIADYAF